MKYGYNDGNKEPKKMALFILSSFSPSLFTVVRAKVAHKIVHPSLSGDLFFFPLFTLYFFFTFLFFTCQFTDQSAGRCFSTLGRQIPYAKHTERERESEITNNNFVMFSILLLLIIGRRSNIVGYLFVYVGALGAKRIGSSVGRCFFFYSLKCIYIVYGGWLSNLSKTTWTRKAARPVFARSSPHRRRKRSPAFGPWLEKE